MKDLLKSVWNRTSRTVKSGGLPVYSPMTRPFGTSDLYRIPDDWKIKGPDFVGVASPKAGTTWWYSLILEHPQVVENGLKEKELAYFYHFGTHGISKEDISVYRQAFASPDNCISGEWSPSYLWYPLALDYLAGAAPETKILIILRNPIDRFISHLNQFKSVYSERFDLGTDLNHMVELFWVFPDSITQSSLSFPLSRLLSLFERDQILILQYEKCKLDIYTEISRTYKFLGIDDGYKPANPGRPVNRIEHKIPDITEEERERLAGYYSPDVQAMKKLFPEIDISLWPEFSE
ncbi:MAG TPA: sulfotransferase domain-containing protein [Thermodesulfobacteriota bacterium]|nr:sulfotransferase domain-containing protein [Thermodesulfobacteriota bacterium]